MRFTGDDRTGGTGCWGYRYGTGYNGGDWVVWGHFQSPALKARCVMPGQSDFPSSRPIFVATKVRISGKSQRILDNPSSNMAAPFINFE